MWTGLCGTGQSSASDEANIPGKSVLIQTVLLKYDVAMQVQGILLSSSWGGYDVVSYEEDEQTANHHKE